MDSKRRRLGKEREMKRDLDVRSNPHVQKTGAKLWENRDATGDIKFKVEGVEISAHKLILAALSPKFERQFYGQFDDKDKQVIDVNEEGVTAAAFKEFLQFFYLDEVQLRQENIEGVLFLAKESLVEEFYEECVKYLREALSTENVYLSYDLALLHECKELKNDCENLIRSKSMEVFATDGFINCSRSTLSNILKLVPQKATDVFEACISWAKQYCAQNGMNAENNEHLREAIGDVLYRIDFGKMTIEEFMRYYKPYKNLFTDEEREEIFNMIGKVNDFKPKFFVDSNSSVEVETRTMWKWDEEEEVYCGFIHKFSPFARSLSSSEISFSCNREVLLGGFCCGSYSTVTPNITVNISDNNGFVHSESKEFTFHDIFYGGDSYVKLDSPVLIKPETKYNISVTASDDVRLRVFKTTANVKVTLDENTIVTVLSGTVTAINGLMLNI